MKKKIQIVTILKIYWFNFKKSKVLHAYILGGLVSFAFPFYIDYFFQKSSNEAVYNNLIVTEGLKPYQESRIKCNVIYQEILQNAGRDLEDWKLIEDYAIAENLFDKYYFSEEEKNFFMFLVHDSFEAGNEMQKRNNLLNTCHNILNSNAEYLSLLLKKMSTYQKIYNDFQKNIREIQQKKQISLKNKLLKIGLKIPSNFVSLSNWNTFWIKLIQFQENLSNFNEVSKENRKTLLFNIAMREEALQYYSQTYQLWEQFSADTNKLLISTLQRRLE